MTRTKKAAAPKLTKRERSRIRIMHSARVLFEEYGIENVTFQMIADHTDMCRTTIFNHFSSMEDLMVALTIQEIEDVGEVFEKEGLKGRELIFGLFDKFLEDACNYPYFAGALAGRMILSGSDDNPVKYLEKKIMDALTDEGYADPEKGAVLVEGVYFGLTAHYYVNCRHFDPETIKREAHELIEMIIGGKK